MARTVATTVLWALAAVVLALVAWEWEANRHLMVQIPGLRQNEQELTRLRRETHALSVLESIESGKLLAKARAAKAQRAVNAARPARGNAPLRPDFVGIADLQEAGRETPANAFLSYERALYHLDVGALAGMLAISDTQQREIAAIFSRLPAADQSAYGSPPAMFALLYAYVNPVYLTGLKVAGTQTAAENQATVATDWEFPGGQVRTHYVPLIHSADGWQVVVPDPQLKRVLQQTVERNIPQ